MIYSMTAFARSEVKKDWGTAVWEIRSVNQRYLETYFRLPEQFRSLEPLLRDRFRKRLQRGKVECALRFTANDAAVTKLTLNEELAKQVGQEEDITVELEVESINSYLQDGLKAVPGVTEIKVQGMVLEIRCRREARPQIAETALRHGKSLFATRTRDPGL